MDDGSMIKRYWLLLVLVACLSPGTAAAQRYADDSLSDQLYLYKVKSVDEFIERFNDEQQSFLRKELRKQRQDISVTRQQMLVHLFDAQKKDWNTVELKNFLQDLVNDSVHYQLNFTDSTWVAAAQCRFRLDNNKEIVIPLRLRIKNNEPIGARWLICGVADAAELSAPPPGYVPEKSGGFRFIPSSSHSTGFLYLHDAFQDLDNLTAYFDEGFLASGGGNKLIHALATKKIRFVHVDLLDFYFFQVNNWVFKVSNRERNMMNHGWLITDLFRISEIQKRSFFK